MHYKEFLPCRNLQKYVKCFWILRKSDHSIPHAKETVLPDGTFEIVFNLADRFQRFCANGEIEIQPAAILVGQMRKAIQIEPLGVVDLFGVRFQTIGAYHFFRFSLNELTDQIQSLDLVIDKANKYLETQISEASTTSERITIIENLLVKKLCENDKTDRSMEIVVAYILQNCGMAPVKEIVKEFGISERQLERHFLHQIGLSPKFFSRIIRLQNVVNALRRSTEKDFTQIATSFGYYDQAHFIHEFNAFTGKTPSVFLNEQNQMAEFFAG